MPLENYIALSIFKTLKLTQQSIEIHLLLLTDQLQNVKIIFILNKTIIDSFSSISF